MANPTGKIAMKAMTVAVGIPVGRLTKRLVEQAWSTARPNDPPRKPNDSGVRWGDAISWAALSAVGVVIADLATRRGAEEMWRTLLGTEPPPPKPSKAQRKLEKAQQSL